MNTLHRQFLILILSGWVNRSQQDVIEYLQAENRVLREQLGDGRLLFTDGQRRRLAAKAKTIGRKGLFADRKYKRGFGSTSEYGCYDNSRG